ncbi:MAG: inositol monophosphatase family protein [Bacteroidota bacterium]
MRYQHELSIAKKAALSAAEIIREFATSENFNIALKGKNDLVTDADLASEKAILSIINEVFPDDEILAEETSSKRSLPDGRVWIIDPIDGTTNFAHGFPVYCVSIALWDKHTPKVGLVLEVANSELFYATEEGGAFRNEQPITVSQNQDPSQSLIGTGFPYNNLDLVDNYLKLFRMLMDETHGVRRPGSAAWDLCNMACGRFEGFYEYGLSPWDVAAGALIIREAGGIVTDWNGGNNWLFGQRIVAGNAAIHSFLKEKIALSFGKEQRSV